MIRSALVAEMILLLALVSMVTFIGTFTPAVLSPVEACYPLSECNFLQAWDGFKSPAGIAVDPQSGNITVADLGNNRIEEFNATGYFLTAWGCKGAYNATCPASVSPGEFSSPAGVTVDSSGLVYVADESNNRIEKFTLNGTFLITWGSAGGGAAQFNHPMGIASDNFGNVYVTDAGNNRVEKFNNTGGFVVGWGCRTANVTACSALSNGGSFTTPVGIAADTLGNVYVTDQGNNRVEKFTDVGTFIGAFGCGVANVTSCSPGSGDGNFNNPTGISVDSSNDFYVVDSGNNRVEKFYPNGTFIGQWGAAGPETGQFTNPGWLAINQFSGNVYVTDTGNNRVELFGVPPLACGIGI